MEDLQKMKDYVIEKTDSEVQNLLKEIEENEYVRSGSLDICNGLVIAHYNLYTKRE